MDESNLRFFENDREAATIFASTLFYSVEALNLDIPVQLIGELMQLGAKIAYNYLEDIGIDPESDQMHEFIVELSKRADGELVKCLP